MELVQAELDLPTPPLPCQAFDMICGSGTGGSVSSTCYNAGSSNRVYDLVQLQ